eukprot:TRINITY_DN2482_c0_g1_i2.p1 TRINITY_DN2482_c0_g1~~TRINITY_DN2482_c0_g1_i2.p1  ORF type:complete len:759 (+),score=306.53 TRINITY_DN2482_c0_g1_i2:119-2395(+)
MASEQKTTSFLESVTNTLTDAKDSLLGREPINRNAPAAPTAPAVEHVTPVHMNLKEKVEEAHEKLEHKPTFIPAANPEQQRMMDSLQSMGVRDLGRDFFFFRQFYNEREISLYWKEFSEAQNKADGLVTVGNLTRIGGRRPEFEHVHRALSGQSSEQTLNFSQFLGLLKKQKGREENQTASNPSELFRPDLLTSDSEKSGIHSSSDEERYILTHFVNLLLEKDDTVQGILPLDYRSSKLGMEFADGGLFCKLINRIRPDTINENTFHFGEDLHFLQIMDNHVMNLKAAKTLGADVADVDPKGLIEGDIRQALAFLEPLFKLVFGHGSHTYQKNEIQRLSEPTLYKTKLDLGEGLLGRPSEPGYFIPNLATPQLTTAPSESKLTELERGMSAETAQSRQAEADRIRELETELNNRRAQYESLSSSYNNLLNELNLSKAKQNLDMAEHNQMMQRQRDQEADRQRMDGERAERERMERERERMMREREAPAMPAASTTTTTTATTTLSTEVPVSNQTSYSQQAYTQPAYSQSGATTYSTAPQVSNQTSYSQQAYTQPAATTISQPTATSQPTTVSLASLASNVETLPQPVSRAGDALVKGILRWKRRFLAIDGNHLYIYKHSGINSARQSILLSGATISRDTDASKEFGLYVHNDSQKQKAHIAFTSAALMNEWLNDMQLAQQQAQSVGGRRAAGVFTQTQSAPRKIVASPIAARRNEPVQNYQNANYGSNFQPVFSVTATDPKVANTEQGRTAPNPTFIK